MNCYKIENFLTSNNKFVNISNNYWFDSRTQNLYLRQYLSEDFVYPVQIDPSQAMERFFVYFVFQQKEIERGFTSLYFFLVETVELESTTPCMSSKYSNQLSYASVFNRLEYYTTKSVKMQYLFEKKFKKLFF